MSSGADMDVEAMIPFVEEEKEERFWTPGKESSLREALLFIVIRAIKNKQRKEENEKRVFRFR